MAQTIDTGAIVTSLGRLAHCVCRLVTRCCHGQRPSSSTSRLKLRKPYQASGRTKLADTPPGRWTVARAVEGVDVGPLGALYRPRYFHDGIAVHGYPSVPAYPASHGCVRVTNAAMDWIWTNGLMPMGSQVWVH